MLKFQEIYIYIKKNINLRHSSAQVSFPSVMQKYSSRVPIFW